MVSLRKLPDKCPNPLCGASSSQFEQWMPGKYKCGKCHRPVSFIEPAAPVVKPRATPVEETIAKERANPREETIENERATIIEETMAEERATELEETIAVERKSIEKTMTKERADLIEALKGVKHGGIFKVLDAHRDEVLKIAASIGFAPTDKLLGLGMNTIHTWKTSRKIAVKSPTRGGRQKCTDSAKKPDSLPKEKYDFALGAFAGLEEPATIASIRKLMELTTQEVDKFRQEWDKSAKQYGDDAGARYDAFSEVEFDTFGMDAITEILDSWIMTIGDKDIVVLGLVAFKEAIHGIQALEPPDPDRVKSEDAQV